MRRVFCSGCEASVMLDESGACPKGHPVSCYRDIGDVGPAADAAPPILAVDPGPSAREPRPLPVPPPRKPKRWPWVAAVAIVLLACAALSVGFVELLRGAGGPSASDTNAPGPYPPKLPLLTEPYKPPNEDQKHWALALSAVLAAQNNDQLDTLAGGDITKGNLLTAIESRLVDGWGVNSRADLLVELDSLENGGHRKGFDELRSSLARAPAWQVALIQAQGNGAQPRDQVHVVLASGKALGAKSISAWDFGRYVALCRWGYVMGYLTEDEAWRRIMPVARAMQSRFTSWKDYSDDYLIGREYWSPGRSDQPEITAVTMNLLNAPGSPWLVLPWDLDLRPGARIDPRVKASPWAVNTGPVPPGVHEINVQIK